MKRGTNPNVRQNQRIWGHATFDCEPSKEYEGAIAIAKPTTWWRIHWVSHALGAHGGPPETGCISSSELFVFRTRNFWLWQVHRNPMWNLISYITYVNVDCPSVWVAAETRCFRMGSLWIVCAPPFKKQSCSKRYSLHTCPDLNAFYAVPFHTTAEWIVVQFAHMHFKMFAMGSAICTHAATLQQWIVLVKLAYMLLQPFFSRY